MKKILPILLSTVTLFFFNKTNAQVALAFNGTNNYVSTNGSPVLNNQSRTVDAWIKTTNTVTTQNVICDWGVISPNGSRFTLNMINTKLRIEVGGVGMTGTTNINTGQWVHVSAVYESSITTGNNVFVYVNGLLDATGTFTGYPTLTTTTTVGFRIGARVDGINFFTGAIDEVKVYNYARTQQQVAADTVESCLPQTGLVAYYKLNEGIAGATNTGSTTAIDYSGFGNNGTLNSFTLSGTASNWVPGRVRSGGPVITASPSSNICSGSSLTLSAIAANSYTWSNGNTTSTTIAVSPTITSTYSIISTNSLNCSVTSSITVNVNSALPSVSIAIAQNPICSGASTSFTATGAQTYSWTGGLINGQIFTPTTTNSYTLTAGNGCGTVSSVQTITVVPLQISAVASSSSVCQGYTCSLTASSSVNGYTWSPGSQTGTLIMVTPLLPTIYTVTASDGTCVGTQTIQVLTKPTPSISINNTVVTICEGTAASFIASGAGNNGTYLWSPGGSNNASITVSPITTTLYVVNGTNSVGCSSSAQIPVIVIAKPTLTTSASQTLVCNGATVSLNAGGAGTYTWNSGATTASTVISPTFSFNVYTVTATASNNTCTATGTIAIGVITPSVNYTSTQAICNGASATLSASGANTYTWNNISTGASGQQVVTPTTTSTYSLIANTQSISTSCLSTYIATVIVNPTPTVTAVASITATICKGQTNTLTASGANSYTWSGVSSNSLQVVVSPTSTSTYTVVGATTAGCTGSSQIQVKVNNCLGISEYKTNSEFMVYPNPSTGEFYISSEVEMTLELLGLDGQLIKIIQINNGQTRVDVSDMNKGIYLLRDKNTLLIRGQKVVIQ